jgi:hypothetical protein
MEGMRTLSNPRHKWGHDTSIGLQEMGWECVVWIGSGGGCWEHANVCLFSVTGTELIDMPKHLCAILPSEEGPCCSFIFMKLKSKF